MSAYRDRPLECPRCRRELHRDQTREVWSCEPCRGVLVGVGELIENLVKVAPRLLPEGGARSVSTIGRRTAALLLRCPTCAFPMEPVFLGSVELDRCYHDEQIWFDRGERELVIERAREQEPELGVFASLMRRLAGPA